MLSKKTPKLSWLSEDSDICLIRHRFVANFCSHLLVASVSSEVKCDGIWNGSAGRWWCQNGQWCILRCPVLIGCWYHWRHSATWTSSSKSPSCQAEHPGCVHHWRYRDGVKGGRIWMFTHGLKKINFSFYTIVHLLVLMSCLALWSALYWRGRGSNRKSL